MELAQRPTFVRDVRFNPIDFATAASELYVGYQLGQKVDEVADAIVDALNGIAELAKSIANLFDKIDEVIEAINKLLEALSKKIDAAFCAAHFSAILASSQYLSDYMTRLQVHIKSLEAQGLPLTATDDSAKYLFDRIETEAKSVYLAMVSYLRQEGSAGPSELAIATLCRAIGMWAQASTMIIRFRYSAKDRISVWDTPQHEYIKGVFDDFFKNAQDLRNQFQSDMSTGGAIWLPRPNQQTATTDGIQFYLASVPYKQTYAANEIQPNQPGNLFAIDASGGLHSLVVLEVVQNPLQPTSYRWKSVGSTSSAAQGFAKVEARRGDVEQYLARTQDYQLIKTQKIDPALTKPLIGW